MVPSTVSRAGWKDVSPVRAKPGSLSQPPLARNPDFAKTTFPLPQEWQGVWGVGVPSIPPHGPSQSCNPKAFPRGQDMGNKLTLLHI